VAEPKTERIYVRLPNWVGDVVMAQPFLSALRRGFPEACIEVHGKKHTFSFIRPCGSYDYEIPLEREPGPLWPFKEGRRVRAVRPAFDLAIVLPNSLSSGIIAWTIGAPRRLGYRLNARGPLLTEALYAKKVGRLRPIPMIDYYLKLAAQAGASIEGIPRRPVLPITEEAKAWADDFLSRNGVKDGDVIWAFNAGGAWLTKRYIPEYVAELADRIAARGARPLILGGPDELAIGETIRSSAKSSELFGLPEEVVPLDRLTAVLARCQILITTDSGPRHFGVAAGIPVLVTIGPTHPGYTGVDYDRLAIVCDEVECWPCHLKQCPLAGDEHFKCMRRLDPDRVLGAADQLLLGASQG